MSQKQPHPSILKACQYIDRCTDYMPSLGEVAEVVGCSPTHLQKMFTKALGISPRAYADRLRRERFKNALANGADVCEALYDAGYGSSSRVYESTDAHMGMTPKAYRAKGKGQTIYYVVVRCALGWLLVAATEKGICSVRIGTQKRLMVSALKNEFTEAALINSQEHLHDWVQRLVDYLSGSLPWPSLPYDVQASAFQHRVWSHLRTIPVGETQYYSEIAEAIGAPRAARAVAKACATNPVALIVPCHRVLPKSGGVGGFRWGVKRKKELLAMEKEFWLGSLNKLDDFLDQSQGEQHGPTR